MRSEFIAGAALMALVAAQGVWAAADGQGNPPPSSQATPAAQKSKGPSEAKSRKYFTDLPLLNQDGDEVKFYTDVLKGKVVVINFIFTNCGDACPLLTFKLTQVRDALGGHFGDPVHFVSISIDPENDTPEALREFARQQRAEDEAWTYLTGSKRNIDAIVTRFGQYTEDVESHSTVMIAGNVDEGKWSKIPPQAPAGAIALKVRDMFVPIGQ